MMSRKVNLVVALLAVILAVCAAKSLRSVDAQNVPPVNGACCGKKPTFPNIPANPTTPAQNYSTFTGQIAIVTGQLIGGSSVVVVDLKNENGGVGVDKNWDSSSTPPTQTYRHPAWTTLQMGDVFGLTLDNQGDVFVTPTTAYFTKSMPPGGSGRVYRIDGTTGNVNTFVTLPNNGPALGNINYNCAVDSYYVSNMADGRIYQIKRPTAASATGNIIANYDHQSGTIVTGAAATAMESGENYSNFTPKNKPGVKRGGRVWGLAVYRGRLYYGVWRQDSGNHIGADSAANEVYSIALTSTGGFVSGTAQPEINLPTLDKTNPWPANPLNYSNPVSSISFNQAGDMLVAERTMNGDTNNLSGIFKAHESRVLEYTQAPLTSTTTQWTLQQPTKFGIGVLNYTARPSSAGGAVHDPFGARNWVTADAMHYFPGYPVTGDIGAAQTQRLYGIQGLPISGGTIHNSILVDLTDSPMNADKNQMGDVDIPCLSCGATATPTPSPSPAECCDKIAAVPHPQQNVSLDYRTFTITNLKAPSSPICSVDISLNPTPNPIWQGGDLYVDNVLIPTATRFVSPYTRIPNKPAGSTISAVNTVKFNLGVDYTIGWTGTATFVVHHCDGSLCTLSYGPWSAQPPPTIPGGDVFDANVAQQGKLYTIGLQLKQRNWKGAIKWISFRVADENSQIFAAAAPSVTGARGRAVADALLEDNGLNKGYVLYTFAQALKAGQAGSMFNLVLQRESNEANSPLVIWTTYDANGNALETGTINGTAR